MNFMIREGNYILRTENAYVYKEKIWFVEYGCNELFYHDLSTNETVFVCKITSEKEYQYRLIGAIIARENFLYLIPFSAKKLYVVNLDTFNIRGIDIKEPLPDKFSNYLENAKFMCAHIYKDTLYMISTSYPAIVEYNCESEEISYHQNWIGDILSRKMFDDNAFFRKSILVGSKIYAPSCMANVVLEFDLETKSSKIYEVGSQECSYSSICQVGDVFWLSPRRNGPFVKWDSKKEQWWEYNQYPETYVSCEGSFADIVYWNNKIYAIPLNAEMIIRIDEFDERMEICANINASHMQACISNNLMYCFEHKMGRIFTLDLKECCEVQELRMPIERQEYHRRTLSRAYNILSGKCQRGKDEVLYESHQGILDDFISYIII